jgi:hypothetical protein
MPMRNRLLYVVGVLAVTRLAWGVPSATGLPAKLESVAKVAFADIQKAKAALNAGNTKAGQSYLAKSEGLLKSVLVGLPKSGSTTPGGNTEPTQQSGQQSTASRAESEVAKLDPSLASKVGVDNEKPAPDGVDGGAGAQAQTQAPPGQKSTIAEIESAYQKVSLARSLLKRGDSSSAKSVLDQIPASPLGLLKSASGL